MQVGLTSLLLTYAEEPSSGLLAFGLIVVLTAGALAGWRRLRLTQAAPLAWRRQISAFVGLAPCGVLTLLLGTVDGAPLLNPLAGALLAAAAFFAHCATDPSRVGFWHHRRLRPLGIIATIAGTAALGLLFPRPELIPLAFAVAIFLRHQRATATLLVQGLDDVEALRQKLLSRDAAAQAQGVAPENWHDKVAKAG